MHDLYEDVEGVRRCNRELKEVKLLQHLELFQMHLNGKSFPCAWHEGIRENGGTHPLILNRGTRWV